ncbi:MAG: vWA domain-containing protein [Janthinobacterium lividum]
MNLLNPLNFLWALPLLGGIIALWMLRLKRQTTTVSSLYLWNTLLQETQANAPFQKLRRNLLLFLQLLAAFLLVFALARPFVYGQGLTGHTIVIVIDTSASMNATDVQPSRLAAAKAAADDFVDHQMRGGDVATILSASSKPQSLLSGFTGDSNRLKAAIDGAGDTDTVADMPSALTLAQSLVGTHAGAQIRVFSDGAYSADDLRRLASIPLGGTDVALTSIGTTTPDNLAITRLDGRRNPQTGINEVFAEVQNLGGKPHSGGTLTLLKDGRLVDARALNFTNGTQVETFDSPLLKDGGIVTARLDDVKDDLATDNQASLVLSPPHPRRVLLVTDGNIFLERGLNLDPDVVLAECTPDEFTTLGKSGAGYGMVVFDGALPKAPLPPGNYLVFGANSGQMPVTVSGSSDTPTFIDENQSHPIMRFVDLDGLHLRTALHTQAQSWGQSLADADSGPLIAVGDHDGLRVVSVSFNLSDSDWPLRVSFPIFLTNAVRWLTAAGGLGADQPETPTGGVAALTIPAGQSSVSITRPDGSVTAVNAPNTGGVVLVDDTREAGIYHAKLTGGIDYPFAVNLDNADESRPAAQKPAILTHPGTPQVAAVHLPLSRRAKDDLWPTLAAAALFLLLLEWFVFHRRI